MQTRRAGPQAPDHWTIPAWRYSTAASISRGPSGAQQSYAEATFRARATHTWIATSPVRVTAAQRTSSTARRAERFAATLGRLGIDADVQVVAYDQGNGAYAARLWWMLRWLGHASVAVLNGGFAAWQRAGAARLRKRRRDPRAPRFASPGARRLTRQVCTTVELQKALSLDAIALIDARGGGPLRRSKRDHRSGRRPRSGRSQPSIRRQSRRAGPLSRAGGAASPLERDLAGRPAGTGRSCMCGSGVTACHNLLALEIAGLTGAQLYAGSWSEWIRDPRPPGRHAVHEVADVICYGARP